ncbi:chemotaxis protein CheW [Allosphingosinicella deserti]|uniref:CheW-like domain-containing protein n=1 Tax=Allosphingosinicella deserti TaxID=2116704 RepID=A0A2P7QRG7_9SPHN|nr:chemotaxis protein CheW [Sphingomonas deserti]PSJ40578.1 hypothetical protein C7I55_09635 [Sphingomonas deserti]
MNAHAGMLTIAAPAAVVARHAASVDDAGAAAGTCDAGVAEQVHDASGTADAWPVSLRENDAEDSAGTRARLPGGADAAASTAPDGVASQRPRSGSDEPPAAPVRAAAAETLDVGLMRLCGRDLALPADHVREVVPRPAMLQPVFTAGGAIGSIVIRGRVIPIVDLKPLLGFAAAQGDGAAASAATDSATATSANALTAPAATDAAGPEQAVIVVLRQGDALLGLLMDSVSGLARLRRDSLQACEIPGMPGQLVTRNFLHGEAVVGLVDPAAIFALPGIPHARETAPQDRGAAGGARRPIVLLSVAGAEIALDAGRVVATVPNAALRPGPVPSSTWVGVVDYLGREVPVVDDLALLGLSGRAGETGAEPIVLLRVEGDHLLGLKIDRVHRILQVPAADIRPLPPATAARLSLFSGAIVDPDGRESLLLAADALARSEALRTIGALSRIKGVAARGAGTAPSAIAAAKAAVPGLAAAGIAGSGAATTAQGASRPFLIFRLGDRHRAVPLTSVTQIIAFPAGASRLDVPGSGLFGLASHNGRPLPLVDLGSDGAPRDMDFAALGAVILVVDVDDAVTGCIVDELEMVADAVPQRRPALSAAEPGHFLEARIGGVARAVTICDLAEEARQRA